MLRKINWHKSKRYPKNRKLKHLLTKRSSSRCLILVVLSRIQILWTSRTKKQTIHSWTSPRPKPISIRKKEDMNHLGTVRFIQTKTKNLLLTKVQSHGRWQIQSLIQTSLYKPCWSLVSKPLRQSAKSMRKDDNSMPLWLLTVRRKWRISSKRDRRRGRSRWNFKFNSMINWSNFVRKPSASEKW